MPLGGYRGTCYLTVGLGLGYCGRLLVVHTYLYYFWLSLYHTLVIQLFQTVTEDVFIWSVGPKHSVNPSLNCTVEIVLLTDLLNLGVYVPPRQKV